jgi:predicted transcriptional regulator
MDLSGEYRRNIKRDRIYEFASQHPGAMVKDIAQHTGLSQSTLGRYLAEIRTEWRRELKSKADAKSRKM